MGRYSANNAVDYSTARTKWLLRILTLIASVILASAVFGGAPTIATSIDVQKSAPVVAVNQPTPTRASPKATASAVPEVTASIAPAATPTPTIPLKSAPLQLVIKDADIDITIGKLPMSAEQIAQRIYEAPEEPIGYWAQFEEAGMTYNDVPGSDMIDATFIIGHSCTVDACYTASGVLLNRSDWQFTRLADPNKVKKGTAVSIFTANGEVCSSVIEINHVGRYDAAAQDVILQEATRQRYIVINTCDTISGADNIATLVVSKVHPCGA